MKRSISLLLALTLSVSLFACGPKGLGDETAGGTEAATEPDTDRIIGDEDRLYDQLELTDVHTVTVDASVRHQTIESFGASGAWWSQIVGENRATRDTIATLLFDPEKGIGLNCYRYNIGGGSRNAGANSPSIGDVWRRTYSFETAPGEYDWSRDSGAVWMMTKAAELGVDEIVMFVNSPIERLTKNGRTYADSSMTDKSNLHPSNYDAFAKYVLDVAEHFKSEGLPIKYISPVNEPQYGWDYPPENVWGQEGCHYSNTELVNILKLFVERLEERDGLDGVQISAPDGGSWNADTLEFCVMIARDKLLREKLAGIDNHSYWTETETKKTFKRTIDRVAPGITLRESEWCEMVNGRDLSMDSALVLAKTVYEDMTILDVVSWQYWIAVSCYDYRDGLIYVDAQGNNVQTPKRLWAMGNYSRFIDRGYTRVDCSFDIPDVYVSAYEGVNENGEKETVLVFVNPEKTVRSIGFSGLDTSVYNRISVNVTDRSHDLAETYYAAFLDGTAVTIPPQCVATVVISGK